MGNIFDILPEKYKAVRVYCNSKIPNMSNKDLNKETCWFWKTELGGIKKQEKNIPKRWF